MPSSDLAHHGSRHQCLFDNPRLLVLAPAPSALDTENLPIHLCVTLRLALRSQPPRRPSLQQGGRCRRDTGNAARPVNLPDDAHEGVSARQNREYRACVAEFAAEGHHPIAGPLDFSGPVAFHCDQWRDCAASKWSRAARKSAEVDQSPSEGARTPLDDDCDGIPLFVEELTKTVLQSDIKSADMRRLACRSSKLLLEKWNAPVGGRERKEGGEERQRLCASLRSIARRAWAGGARRSAHHLGRARNPA